VRGGIAALGLGAGLAAAPASAAPPPPEGLCPQYSAGASPALRQDAAAPRLAPGDQIQLSGLAAIAHLLPPEVWRNRRIFFFEGMRMAIGACHRRYPTAAFYAQATRDFAGRAHVDKQGNLEGYVAGLPFPPEQIDPKDEQAGVKWAWNMQQRYRGGGPSGRFRLLDLPDRLGKAQTYIGKFFYIRTAHRADLAASQYRIAEASKSVFAAGGSFSDPFDARGLAWRQIRPRDADQDFREPDDTFIYVPEMRKVRRASAAWSDGVYTPRYRTAGTGGGGGGAPFSGGGSKYAPQIDTIAPTSYLSTQATEDIRRGFTGLALRPNAYRWRVLREQEVLALMNSATLGWPVHGNRNYGPSGLSLAYDRWDVRWAVVLRGFARREVGGVAAVTLWLDWQTRRPLYYITQRKNGLLLDVGILGYRFSGDRPEYPAFPGGELVNVFDPVVAAFYYVPGGGSGWRRESYGVKSLPTDPGKLRSLTSVDSLAHGH